jgi:hypothetical protein
MEKRNYHAQEPKLIERLESFLNKQKDSALEKKAGCTEMQATADQLSRLRELGIRPKWKATSSEAQEMICHYRTILKLGRIP